MVASRPRGLAEAIRYALSRWSALCRFLDDGRIDLDNNPVERAIRPVALGRKNHLFAGSDGGGHRWATVCSLIATAKLNDVEPSAYLKDILERMTEGHPMIDSTSSYPGTGRKYLSINNNVRRRDAYGNLDLPKLKLSQYEVFGTHCSIIQKLEG